jgi:sulfite exporter TauE/SafE
MLSSIHPLGERARHSTWWFTTVAYIVGSAAGGALLGATAGFVGLALSTAGLSLSPAVVTVVCVIALVVDLVAGRVHLPSWHRQVNEDWLHRYRGWVYGVGYGFQLGLGVVTIVTTASVYAVVALAAFSGSVATGALIGGAFGLLRALPVVGLGAVREPVRLRRLHERIDALAVPAARASTSALAVVAVAVWAVR